MRERLLERLQQAGHLVALERAGHEHVAELVEARELSVVERKGHALSLVWLGARGRSATLDLSLGLPVRSVRREPMKTAVVQSVCECQARLGAELDEQRRAVRGWARQRTRELLAPANNVGTGTESFQIGWACPFCTRNTLRSFDVGALVYQEKPALPSVPPVSRPTPRSTAPGG